VYKTFAEYNRLFPRERSARVARLADPRKVAAAWASDCLAAIDRILVAATVADSGAAEQSESSTQLKPG